MTDHCSINPLGHAVLGKSVLLSFRGVRISQLASRHWLFFYNSTLFIYLFRKNILFLTYTTSITDGPLSHICVKWALFSTALLFSWGLHIDGGESYRSSSRLIRPRPLIVICVPNFSQSLSLLAVMNYSSCLMIQLALCWTASN